MSRLHPFLFLFALFLLGWGASQTAAVPVYNLPPVIINEVMVSNASAVLDASFTNFSDWIELHNTTNAPINLTGYWLSDDPLLLQMWPFPNGTVIPAHGFLLVWADNENTGLHTNFKLKASGEVITLSDGGGAVVDVLDYRGIPQRPNVAYGRAPAANTTWLYYDAPFATPGGPNHPSMGLPTAEQSPLPTPSLPGGFYTTTLALHWLSESPTADLYYTLDGSTPTTTSLPYLGQPIPITTTTVVRLRGYENGRLPSPIATHTYFLNQQFTLPVISLATDPAYFFDDQIGLYVPGIYFNPGNPTWTGNYFQKWERPLSFEYYDAQQAFQFQFDGGVEIHGNFSRSLRQKGLEIITGGQYGSSDVRYQLFTEKEIDRFERFLLRASGGDQYSTFFRDAFQHRLLVGQMDIDLQAYQPTIVFLNGQYWGIHNLREKIGADYIKRNHGYDEEEIDLLNRRGTSPDDIIIGSNADYVALLNFIETNNMATAANYEYVKTQIDVHQLMNYWLAQIYFDNRDWPNNNIRYWRPHGGQWRWLLFDVDEGFGFRDSGSWTRNTVQIATTSNATVPTWSTLIMRRLLQNPEFRDEFVQRFAAHMSITFEPTRVTSIIDEIQAMLTPEMPAHIVRWQDTSGAGLHIPSVESWISGTSRIQRMRLFAQNRRDVVYTHLDDRFTAVNGTADLTFITQNPEMGHIAVHEVPVPASPFTGRFFRNIPIQLEAIPAQGYDFVEWRLGATPVSTHTHYTLSINSNATVTAVFTPLPRVIINEIHYNPAASQGDDALYEFIELYNDHPDPVDLSGYYMEGVVYTFTVGTVIAPGQHLVLAQTAATYAGQGYDVYQWHSGGLNNTGEAIRLFTSRGWLVNEVVYADSPPWPTSPDGGGPSLELRHPSLDNALFASWEPSLALGGTPGRPNNDDRPLIHNSPTRLLPEGPLGQTTFYPITITLAHASGLTVTVDYATADGTAVAGQDYLPLSGTLTFPPSTTSQTVSLGVVGNHRYEASRTAQLLLSNPSGGALGTAATQLLIVDDDPLPTLSMGDVTVGEGVGTAVLTATLSNPSAFPISVAYATADGTAIAGQDYQPANGTLNFSADTLTQTISLTIVDDDQYQPDKQLFVHLSQISNALLATPQITVTILNDDPIPPHLSVVGHTAAEGQAGQLTHFPFTVTLSFPHPLTVTVAYATADGTASAGQDYTPISGTLTFAPHQTVQVVLVPVLGDELYEADETFWLRLSQPVQAILEVAEAEGIIENDDAPPTLDVVGGVTAEGDEGLSSALFTVTLSAASGLTTTVFVATADGTAVAGHDYLPISDTLTFAPAQTSHTLAVPVVGNEWYGLDKSFSLVLSDPVGAVLGTATAEMLIVEDDPLPLLTMQGVAVQEGDVAQTWVTLTLTLDRGSELTSTVGFATADETAVAGVDYLPLSGTLTFAPYQTSHTMAIAVLGNTTPQPNRTFVVQLDAPNQVRLAQLTAEILIVDDDEESVATPWAVYLPLVVR